MGIQRRATDGDTDTGWSKGLPAKLFWPNLFASGFHRLALLVAVLFRNRKPHDKKGFEDGILAIEAGEIAWEHIFFKEAFQSAAEFLGADRVVRLSIRKDKRYVQQVREFVIAQRVTHYFYDPRSGSQSLPVALLQAFQLVALFSRRGIIPIAYCTDISLRRWRFQAAIVTAMGGVCVCLTHEDIAKKMVPHERVIGPAIMPISEKTLRELDGLRASKEPNTPLKVSFFGSLYEPRVSQLEKIRLGLQSAGVTLEIKGRAPGGERISDVEYWKEIISTDILVSTSSQVQIPGMDLGHANHLIYRFTEALACGVCLVIEDAPGADRIFTNLEDLILWWTPEDAIRQVAALARDGARVRKIGETGGFRLRSIASEKTFWTAIRNSIS